MLQRYQILIVMLLMLGASSSYGGILFEIGPTWNNYSFEPEHEEDTPNYYGYGVKTAFGYSIHQVWDLGLFAHYTPGRLESASVSEDDAVLIQYGAETGVRILEMFYMGVRGGVWDYQLKRAKKTEEVRGHWQGVGGSGILGLILPVSKQAFWQTTMEVGQGVLTRSDREESQDPSKKRTLTHISVQLSFVYNSYSTSLASGAILNSFMDSVF